MPRRLSRPLSRFEHDPLVWLEDLPASELRPVELEVAARRAARRTPGQLLAASSRREVEPAPVDARVLDRLVATAWEHLPEAFEALDLAPVEPLGASHALAGTAQDNVLAASRDLEVMSDPTIAFARLAATRRRKDRAGAVRLAAMPRVVRMQRLEAATHTRHFRLCALGTAGRARPSEGFLLAALRQHVDAHVKVLLGLREAGVRITSLALRVADPALSLTLARRAGLDPEAGRWQQVQAAWAEQGCPNRRHEAPEELLEPSDTRLLARIAALRDKVLVPVEKRYPELDVAFDPARLRQATYYTGPCFHLYVGGFPEGQAWPLVDGGPSDWTAKLLSDRKERFFGSGCGLELLARFLA